MAKDKNKEEVKECTCKRMGDNCPYCLKLMDDILDAYIGANQ